MEESTQEDSSQEISLHPPMKDRSSAAPNQLPQLIQTPSGLALLELQGTINLPTSSDNDTQSDSSKTQEPFEFGKLRFPDYVEGAEGSAWMQRVHLYVGKHQRLTGEVKKLPKPLAVVKKREKRILEGSGGPYEEYGENLQVVEIVKYKLMFSNRPEPVGTENTVTS